MLKYMHIVNILKILEIRFIKNFNFFIMEMFKQAKNTENHIHNEFPSSHDWAATLSTHYQTNFICMPINFTPSNIYFEAKSPYHFISFHP